MRVRTTKLGADGATPLHGSSPDTASVRDQARASKSCEAAQKASQQAQEVELLSDDEAAPMAVDAGSERLLASSTHGQQLTEADHALAHLTQRCAGGCRSAASLHTMRVRPTLQALQDQLVSALHGVVRDGTSLSVLVMGDTGCGKTLLVERSIAEICAAHNPAGGGTGGRVVGVVRLNGLVHTEERTAFQDVARQLCSEFGQEFSKSASFDENLAFLRTMLATLRVHCKSVVFVLDALDRIVRAPRTKQQLLYNLLDVVQHSQVQAAVIGVTTAHDVMDGMEKRVRSRFSHRRMQVTGLLHFEVPKPAPAAPSAGPIRRPPGGAAADATPITYADTPCGVLQDILTLSAPATNTVASTSGGSSESAYPPAAARAPGSHSCGAAFVSAHNAAVAAAVKDPRVKERLQALHVSGLKPRTLMCIARAALDAWEASWGSSGTPTPVTVQHVLAGVRSQEPVSQVGQLLDCSVLQLYLLVAMARLEARHPTGVVNFEMVWDECQSFHDSKGVLAAFTRQAAWRAFEGLVAHNLAYWVSPGAEAAGRAMRYAGACLAVPGADVSAALSKYDRCPNELIKFLHLGA